MTDARATAAAFLESDPRVASFEVATGGDKLDIAVVAAAGTRTCVGATAFVPKTLR